MNTDERRAMRRTARLLLLALGFTIVVTVSLSVLTMATERIDSEINPKFAHQAHMEGTLAPPQLETYGAAIVETCLIEAKFVPCR